jgi:hypothetical protein
MYLNAYILIAKDKGFTYEFNYSIAIVKTL